MGRGRGGAAMLLYVQRTEDEVRYLTLLLCLILLRQSLFIKPEACRVFFKLCWLASNPPHVSAHLPIVFLQQWGL